MFPLSRSIYSTRTSGSVPKVAAGVEVAFEVVATITAFVPGTYTATAPSATGTFVMRTRRGATSVPAPAKGTPSSCVLGAAAGELAVLAPELGNPVPCPPERVADLVKNMKYAPTPIPIRTMTARPMIRRRFMNYLPQHFWPLPREQQLA